jgi:hypothetical protein
LLALDEAVREIVFALAATGELDQTLVMYTSDNGFLLGQHRLDEKNVPYEESIRVPLLLRGPGVPRHRRFEDLVANVDWAPTILDAANAAAGRPVDGRSLLPLLRDRTARRGRAVVIENAAPGESNYTGLRTNRYAYVQYTTGERELYDLDQDPAELQNVIAAGSYARAAGELGADLGRLHACAGRPCLERPALSLRLHYRSGRIRGRRCVRSRLRARIRGSGAVQRVDFRVNGHRVARDSKAPFLRRIALRRVRAGRLAKVRAFIELVDGRELTRDRRVRKCRG